MRWLLLILAVLLLAGGVGWWMDHGANRSASHANPPRRAADDRGPTLYRWVDARGVVNITDTPPKGRHYTVVRVDPDRNIVPMHVGDSSSQPAARH